MRVAILSVSKNGELLSEKLKSLLESDPTIIRIDSFHKDVKGNISYAFKNYDIIIGIMATGILVRSICNSLNNKYDDPGVLSIDDRGNFVISLVSGHMGGANKFTKKIANLLSSTEVITTATDVNGKIGIDVIANHFYLDIINKKKVLRFNKAILEDEILHLKSNSNAISYIEEFFLNNTLEIYDEEKHYMSIENPNNYMECNHEGSDNNNNYINNDHNKINNNQEYNKKNFNYIKDKYNYILDIDENIKDKIIANFQDIELELKPRKLVLGIGSRKNISEKQVLSAIDKAMENLAISSKRIDSLATVSIKKNELGILKASKSLNKPLIIVEKEEIEEFYSSDLSKDCFKSSFVKGKFGIEGVCESCAMIASGRNSKLIHRKIALNGVTVAVAISN